MHYIKVIAMFVILCTWFLSLGFVVASESDTYLSEDIQTACVKYGEEYNVCPELLMAIIEKESSGRQKVVSKAGCVGLMQINPKYHAERMESLGVTDLTDIDGNIHVGTDYLVELYKKHGDLYMVLMTYNMGETRASELFDKAEYSDYAISITERAAELERMHGK